MDFLHGTLRRPRHDLAKCNLDARTPPSSRATRTPQPTSVDLERETVITGRVDDGAGQAVGIAPYGAGIHELDVRVA
jgi:hypothetical protein